MRIVREYSDAIQTRNFASAARLAHPILMIRFGSVSEIEQNLTSSWGEIESAAGPLRGERLGAPTEVFVDGPVMAFSVPVLRSTETVATPVVYLVTSYDGGGTWSILDLVCTDDGWLRAALPSYNGEPNKMLPVHPDAPVPVPDPESPASAK